MLLVDCEDGIELREASIDLPIEEENEGDEERAVELFVFVLRLVSETPFKQSGYFLLQ